MKVRTLCLASLLSLSTFGAQAAFVSCVNGPGDPGADYDILGKVSSATHCAILAPLDASTNDFVGGGNANFANFTVNLEGFFGIDHWLHDGKWDGLGTSGGTDTSSLFDFTGDNQSGTYSYVGPSSGLDKIMLVFKSGNDTNLIGYLVGMSSGSYDSPFVEPPFDFQGGASVKNISHISVYYTTRGGGGGGHVPEPGVVGLLGLGLLGLGLVRRHAR